MQASSRRRLAALGHHLVPERPQPAAASPSESVVTAIETIRSARFPSLVWLRCFTSGGAVGLGEASIQPAGIEARVHETIAPYLLGLPAAAVSRHGLSPPPTPPQGVSR